MVTAYTAPSALRAMAARKTFYGAAWLVVCIVLAHCPVLTWQHTCVFPASPGTLLRLRGGETVHEARIAQKFSSSWLCIVLC